MIVPMIPAALALAIVLVGCAAPPQPAPEVAQVEPDQPPADLRIRETTAPVVRPVWVLDADGETRAQLIDLRSIGGPRCLLVNGGVSCDWGAGH